MGFAMSTDPSRREWLAPAGTPHVPAPPTRSQGVKSAQPIVEIWGFSKTLRRLGEALCVAAECGDGKGCILPDVYHLYKGGSDFAGLGLLAANAIGIFHV